MDLLGHIADSFRKRDNSISQCRLHRRRDRGGCKMSCATREEWLYTIDSMTPIMDGLSVQILHSPNLITNLFTRAVELMGLARLNPSDILPHVI
jgi:hypothetical protein